MSHRRTSRSPTKGCRTKLLAEAEARLQTQQIKRLEAWTKDDKWVQEWYEKTGWNRKSSYWHVYMEGDKELKPLHSTMSKLYPVTAFAHYMGDEVFSLKQTVKRLHECV